MRFLIMPAESLKRATLVSLQLHVSVQYKAHLTTLLSAGMHTCLVSGEAVPMQIYVH